MLDIGATLSVMSYGAWRRLGYERTDLSTTEIKIMTANDQPMKILGVAPLVTLRMAGCHLVEDFWWSISWALTNLSWQILYSGLWCAN